MANHPNRKKQSETAPAITAEMVLGARINAGQTQHQAARTVWRTLRCWQDWEGGQRTPDAAVFELYLIKTKQINFNGWREIFPR